MQDKVVLVSGGAGGIGAEVSASLVNQGCRVLIADLRPSPTLTATDRIVSMTCDITNPDQCHAVADTAVQKFGRLDGMVNCAGVSKPHDSLSLPPADWARMVDIQLNGAFYFAQACARHMLSTGGSIVFITSTNAEAAFPGARPTVARKPVWPC